MAPVRFDRSRIEALVARAAERLEGEWLLVGGSAAATWFSPARTSEDIDLVSLVGTNAARLALMQLAAELAIPIEAVNSAADFYVKRIEGWRDELVVLAQGARATIFRPSATLFLLLKVRRLTAVDLQDCLDLLAYCERSGEAVDRERVRQAMESLPVTSDDPLRERRATLVAVLEAA